MGGKRKDAAAGAIEVLRTEKQDEAVEYRRRGLSYRRIAEVMGISKSDAERLVKAGLRAIVQENVEELRRIDGERLDALYAGLSVAADTGDTHAVMAAVKVLERRARLFGLDAPTKVDAKVSGKSLAEMSDAEVMALRAELAAKAGQ